MNTALARNMYRRTETASSPAPDNPHRVIEITLNELERSVGVLAAAKASGLPYQPDHLNKAFTAIYILQSSLDFEAGGEIAVSLFQVYEFCRIQILHAFRRDEDPKLDEAKLAVSEILSAWQEIRTQVE